MAACRMNDILLSHIPVLLPEALTALAINPNGFYVDATFGRGSHAKAILEKLSPDGRLFAFDKDEEAVSYAKTHLVKDLRFKIFHCSFLHLQSVLEKEGVNGKIDGILFDLGVSSPQLDNPERGFSFSRDGILDMRMDLSQGQSAQEWLATVEEKDLAEILWKYGEERFARRIAKAIIQTRESTPITRTLQLAQVISQAVGGHHEKKHPATRSFQAIRIFINAELTELPNALSQSLTLLKKGGRLVVISFHSLEDRIVKQFIRSKEKGEELPRGLPVKSGHQPILKTLEKAKKPSEKEVNLNPRARSAILRVAEKLS